MQLAHWTTVAATVLFGIGFSAYTMLTVANVTSATFAAVMAAAPGAPAGATHEVRMVQDGAQYRFEPAALAIKPGDVVTFVNVSGGPHNVAFDPAAVPDAVESRLSANMPGQMSPLAGPLLTKANERYTVSFDQVAPGTYTYFCMPHFAMGMKGTITVK